MRNIKSLNDTEKSAIDKLTISVFDYNSHKYECDDRWFEQCQKSGFQYKTRLVVDNHHTFLDGKMDINEGCTLKDYWNRELKIGQTVVRTTKCEKSGLKLGKIEKLSPSTVMSYIILQVREKSTGDIYYCAKPYHRSDCSISIRYHDGGCTAIKSDGRQLMILDNDTIDIVNKLEYKGK